MSDDGESIRRRIAATDNVQPFFDENRNNETYKFTDDFELFALGSVLQRI